MNSTQPTLAVITGASSGLGLVTAKHLASQGWRVIAVGRNPQRAASAEAEIRQAATTAEVNMLLADLSLMADTNKLAKYIMALTDKVDVLINNAGGMPTEKVITEEGLEANFAGNHLGPFLLTKRLLPLLKQAAVDAPSGSVRIINTSSDASEMIPALNLDDIQSLENFSPGLAYCSGKLANVLFTRALATKLKDDDIVVHAMHPGTVDSNFFAAFDDEAMARIGTDTMLTPEQGADTLIWLATDAEPGYSSGGYFYQRAPRTPNPVVNDEQFVERFWVESEKLINSVTV